MTRKIILSCGGRNFTLKLGSRTTSGREYKCKDYALQINIYSERTYVVNVSILHGALYQTPAHSVCNTQHGGPLQVEAWVKSVTFVPGGMWASDQASPQKMSDSVQEVGLLHNVAKNAS